MSFRAVLGAVGITVTMGLPSATTAHAQEAGDAAYTAAQADRGRRIFGAFCSTCHGVDLEGAVGPALAGPSFSAKWSQPDRSAQDLYDVMRTTMPKPAAGTLAESSYLQVLAYVLSRSGLPAGERELAASNDQLKRIRVPVPLNARPPAPEFIAGEGDMTPSGSGPKIGRAHV